MADEKINASDLKEIAKANGLISDSLKDSIASLSKMAKAYDTVIARIDNMNRQTINTKKIQKELEAAQAKQAIAQKKYNEAQATVTDPKRAETYTSELKRYEEQLKKVKEVSISGLPYQIKGAQAILANRKKDLEVAKSALQTEDLAYLATKESLKIAESLVGETKQRLDLEKQLEKEIGIVGKVIGIAAKKLDIFNGKYEELVGNARDGNAKISGGTKFAAGLSVVLYGVYKVLRFAIVNAIDLVKQGLNSLSSGANNPIAGISSAFSSILKQIPYVGGFLGGFLDILTSITGILLEIDDSLVKAGRSLNMDTEQARKLYNQYQKISMASGDTFITSQKLLQSRVELGAAIGVNNSISEANLKTDIKLKDIAGVEADTRAKILENSIVAGQNSEDLVKNVFAQVKGLEKATGISLNYQKVLKEANNLGGYLGLSFAKYPDKISKALVTTQALGLSLKELDGMADSFLDFESSIANEFEAQLLTGKELNLQTARRLFLNNDLAGAAMEINKQVGSSADYLNMNRIAAESLAKSFGMNRDQLSEMLRKQELLAIIGAKQTSNAREQLKIGLERFKTQEALSKAIGEEAYTNLVNASTQEKIASYLDKIKASFVDFLEKSNLIEKIEGFIKYLSSPANMEKMLNTIKGIVARGIEVLGDIAYYMTHVADLFLFGSYDIDDDKIEKMRSSAYNAARNVRSFEIGTPETVSSTLIKNTKQQGGTAGIGGGQTVINNYTTTSSDIIWKADGETIGRVSMASAQSAPIGGNTTNPYMSPKNSSVNGQIG